jgi:hypothetical protein
MHFFGTGGKKGLGEISLFSNFFPRSPFISAGGVRGIKASKNMSFFNAKIVRCPSGGYNKKVFKKFFSKDDLSPEKTVLNLFLKKCSK